MTSRASEMSNQWQRPRIVGKDRNLLVESSDERNKVWINGNGSVYMELHDLFGTGKPVNVYMKPSLEEGFWIYREDVQSKNAKEDEDLLF